MTASLPDLLARRTPGFSLEQPFYTDPGIYQADLERIHNVAAHVRALHNARLAVWPPGGRANLVCGPRPPHTLSSTNAGYVQLRPSPLRPVFVGAGRRRLRRNPHAGARTASDAYQDSQQDEYQSNRGVPQQDEYQLDFETRSNTR